MRPLARPVLAIGLTLAAGGCADAYYNGYYERYGYGYDYAPGIVPYGGLLYGYTAPSYRYVEPRRYVPPPPPRFAPPPPPAASVPRWGPPPAARPPLPPPAPPPVAAPRLRPPPAPGQAYVPPTVGPGTYARRYLQQRGTPEVGTGN
jgi:hypothetical protein